MANISVLAADLGASSGKIARVVFDGNLISAEEEVNIPNKPAQIFNHIYWNVFGLYTDMLQAFAILYQKDTKSIGIDTWGASFGLIGQNNMLLEPVFHYRDNRTKDALQEIYQHISAKEIFFATGCQPNRNYSLPHLFVSAQRDQSLDKVKQLLFLPDLCSYFLTGERSNELSFAGTSALLNSHLSNWNFDLLDKLHIPSSILGNLVSPGSIKGNILKHVAAQNNLSVDTKIVATCSHDTAAAVSAIPGFDENAVYIGSGTNINMGICSNAPIINDEAYEYGFKNTGAMFGKNLLYKDFNAFWLLNQLIKEWQVQHKQYSYEEIFALAKQHMHEALLFDVDDECFNNTGEPISIIMNADLQKRGLNPIIGNDGRLLASIFYSIAHKICDTIEKLEKISGRQFTNIYVINGGARNHMLNQLLANMSKRPVKAGLYTASLLGNALSQLYALGYLRTEGEMKQICQNSFRLDEYTPQH